jgi:class 3 adenylate cyclase
VLFVDLVGFTGQSEQADPEDVRDTLRAYQVAGQQTIEAFGGTMEKFIGDAVMAVAWRSEAGVTSPQAELLRVLRSVLGRENAHTRG